MTKGQCVVVPLHLLGLSVAGKPPVQQDLNLNPAVFCSSGLGLVRGDWSCFTHGARRHDVPNRHVAILKQMGNYVLCSIHTELLVDGCVATRIREAFYLNHVPLKGHGVVRQLC
jgi:hypothetical protein